MDDCLYLGSARLKRTLVSCDWRCKGSRGTDHSALNAEAQEGKTTVLRHCSRLIVAHSTYIYLFLFIYLFLYLSLIFHLYKYRVVIHYEQLVWSWSKHQMKHVYYLVQVISAFL